MCGTVGLESESNKNTRSGFESDSSLSPRTRVPISGHRPVACGRARRAGPPRVLPGPLLFFAEGFRPRLAPHGSGGPLLQNFHATGLSGHHQAVVYSWECWNVFLVTRCPSWCQIALIKEEMLGVQQMLNCMIQPCHRCEHDPARCHRCEQWRRHPWKNFLLVSSKKSPTIYIPTPFTPYIKKNFFNGFALISRRGLNLSGGFGPTLPCGNTTGCEVCRLNIHYLTGLSIWDTASSTHPLPLL